MLICGLSFWAQLGARIGPLGVCRINGRILLANLLQSSRSTLSRGSFLSFLAFKEGMLSTLISETIASLPGFGMAPEGHLSYSFGPNIRTGRTKPCSVRVCID